jgi:hypothetical protein
VGRQQDATVRGPQQAHLAGAMAANANGDMARLLQKK